MTYRSNIWSSLHRKWIKLRLQPIRVFCMHHVCATFDAESMNRADWMQIDEFKSKVLALRQSGVEFISLTEAYQHICHDRLRCKKYAVITFDDGYASLKEILPWLEEHDIPATLFINGKYLDGKSYRKNPKEQYLTQAELFSMTSPLLEMASHGWEHIRTSEMTEQQFEESVVLDTEALSSHPNYIPFWAYTYGTHTQASDAILIEHKLTPVLIDGMMNYNNPHEIQRELL